jgi:uncharacterized membrane protein
MKGELMMNWLLLLFRDLSFTIWLGGLIAIDCIEAPARFRTPELTRAQIVAVGRQVFAAFNRAEILLGTFASVSSLLLILREEDDGFILSVCSYAAIACLCVMMLIALAQMFKLRPRLTELSRSLDLLNRGDGDPRFSEMRQLHRGYVALDVVKMAAGIVAVGFWSLARQ